MTTAAACCSPRTGARETGLAACVAESVRRALEAQAVAVALVSRSSGPVLETRAGTRSPGLDAALCRLVADPATAAVALTPGPDERIVAATLATRGDLVALLAADLGDGVQRREVAVAVMQALAGPLEMILAHAARPAGAGATPVTEGGGPGRRLAVVAHELRRPLAPIASCVTLLRRQGPGVDLQTLAGMMDRQVRDLTRLVQDLVDGEPADAFDFSVRPQHVDVVMAVQDAVQSMLPLVAARRHRVVCSIETVALAVSADPLRLRQIVVNLLENAAKYTPSGGRLEVGVRRDGPDAVIEVRDSGVGILPERLPRIFEGASAVRSRGESAGGRGVGLPLVRRLVVLHGGTVTAASDGAGQGSRFTVRLPVAADTRAKSRAS